MFNKIKKMMLGLLAIASLLLIAGCQPSTQQGPKAPQDLTKDQQGTWLWTETTIGIAKGIPCNESRAPRCSIYVG